MIGLSKRVNINALGMASTKNINALYNAQYIDSGIMSKIKGFVSTLGTVNSDYEKLLEKEEERRRANQNMDNK